MRRDFDLIVGLLILIQFGPLLAETDSFAAARLKMVKEQIASRGIKNKPVLEAMKKVPRHKLVPLTYRKRSYEDRPLPIGKGQTISQPYIVAYMTEKLMLKGSEKVLEIGTGSGYQAAVLAEICKEVYTIEIVDELARRAAGDLKRLGYKNISVKSGDGYRGWPDKAPFAAIILTAAPPKIPQPLIAQLAVGGRLIAPVGDVLQELVLVTRDEKGIHRKRLLGVRFVPMTGEAQK